MSTGQTQNTNPIPSPSNTPLSNPSNGQYVEVNYKTVGWFYSTNINSDTSYNYTYLVLNVTIINHHYSQVNIAGSNGFTTVINNKKYQPILYPPLFMYNGSRTSDHYTYPSTLPQTEILLDNANITGYVVFQFGDPTLHPNPAQIINEPFVLQYSVTYGNQTTSPNATVIINQSG